MVIHLLNLRDLEFPKVLKMAAWVCHCAAKEIKLALCTGRWKRGVGVLALEPGCLGPNSGYKTY